MAETIDKPFDRTVQIRQGFETEAKVLEGRLGIPEGGLRLYSTGVNQALDVDTLSTIVPSTQELLGQTVSSLRNQFPEPPPELMARVSVGTLLFSRTTTPTAGANAVARITQFVAGAAQPAVTVGPGADMVQKMQYRNEVSERLGTVVQEASARLRALREVT